MAFTDVIKLKVLQRGGRDTGLLEWAPRNHKTPFMRRQKASQRMSSDGGSRGGCGVLAGRNVTKGCGWPIAVGKGKEQSVPSSLP